MNVTTSHDAEKVWRPREIVERYRAGERDFRELHVEGPPGELDYAFCGADLGDADFSHSFIIAGFIGAGLRAVRFASANVKTCPFDRADLRNADFSGAAIDAASFEGADLADSNFDVRRRTGTHIAAANTLGMNAIHPAIDADGAALQVWEIARFRITHVS